MGAESGSEPYPQPPSFTCQGCSLFQQPFAQQILIKLLCVKKAPGLGPMGIHIQPESPGLQRGKDKCKSSSRNTILHILVNPISSFL
jgi:hypothetical protein